MHTLKSIHCGVGGRGVWPVRLMHADPRWSPTAFVDISPEALHGARDIVKPASVPCYDDLVHALETHPESDVVVVVTPSALHAQFIETSLLAGKHVLTEKPFTNSMDDAERLVALAERRGLKIVVAQNYRYRPVERRIAKIIRDLVYGEPAYGTVIHHRYRPEVRAFTMDQPMLYEMSVHHFDSVLAIFGRRPISVSAKSFNPPWSKYPGPAAVQALIELEGPVHLTYLGTFTSQDTRWENRIECETAALEWGAGGPIRAVLPGGSPIEEIHVPNEGKSAEEEVLDRFYRYIVEDVEPGVSGRRNLNTMRLVSACIESSRAGRVVRLD